MSLAEKLDQLTELESGEGIIAPNVMRVKKHLRRL